MLRVIKNKEKNATLLQEDTFHAAETAGGVITGEMDAATEAKTNAIIEKVDKESATRKFTGTIKSFFYLFSIAVSLKD